MDTKRSGAPDRGVSIAPANVVELRGKLSRAPEERVLPSGDSVCIFRVVVPRTGPARDRSAVDAIDCAAWSARLRRSVGNWRAGDQVEVRGALRRRFYRAGGAVASRFDVEVERARLIRRADS